jgi:hypothetical protein
LAGQHVLATPGLNAPSRAALVAGSGLLAVLAAYELPRLDHSLNPQATTPGLISFLGVGLTVLALTALLFFVGLRGLLPRSAVFVAAALGYSALVIAVKLSLGPLALYVVHSSGTAVFLFLDGPQAYPGLAAIMAVVYGGAFLALYAIHRSRLEARLGLPVQFATRAVQLFVAMFVVAVAGVLTLFGLFGFFEYTLYVLFSTAIGVLIAGALTLAIFLCSVTFDAAVEQAAATRNIALLSTFAWIGLAFIAAYHVLWLVFLLTLISLWPLHSKTFK